jgi:hypothetical protein
MQRILGTVAAAGLLLFASGCFLGDRASTRTIEITQFQSTALGPFELDTSQLPLGAVTLHQEDNMGGPVTKVTVDIHHPVRIVLVPATQPH